MMETCLSSGSNMDWAFYRWERHITVLSRNDSLNPSLLCGVHRHTRLGALSNINYVLARNAWDGPTQPTRLVKCFIFFSQTTTAVLLPKFSKSTPCLSKLPLSPKFCRPPRWLTNADPFHLARVS